VARDKDSVGIPPHSWGHGTSLCLLGGRSFTSDISASLLPSPACLRRAKRTCACRAACWWAVSPVYTEPGAEGERARVLTCSEDPEGDPRATSSPFTNSRFGPRAGTAASRCRTKTTPGHDSPITNHRISNRNNRKPEMRQLVENKQSDPVLIATFRGSFRAVFLRVSSAAVDSATAQATNHSPLATVFLIATVANSELASNPLESETSLFSNRNKNGSVGLARLRRERFPPFSLFYFPISLVSTSGEGLAEVFDEIFGIFEADRNAHRARVNARSAQLRSRHSVVRGVHRQNHERFDAAEARCQQKNSNAVAESPRACEASFVIEREHGPEGAHLPLRQPMVRVRR
jgi:hypothetical protein